MCYPCTSCGRCGKFDPNSPLYCPPPSIPCLKCGGTIDGATGICDTCGQNAFKPSGGMMATANSFYEDKDNDSDKPIDENSSEASDEKLEDDSNGDSANE